MRRHNLSSHFARELFAASALTLIVCAGCADGSTPTPISGGAGGAGGSVDGSGGQSGSGGDSSSGPTSKASSATSTGSSSDGGGGAGGDPSTSGGGEGGTGPGGGGGEGGGNQCGVECPEGFYDVDNNPLTGECGCEYACDATGDEDPIDEDFEDDNCDGGDGVVEACVYVSLSGDDINQGTRALPMQSIANAIARAVENGVPAVCVGSGTFEENVQLASGVSLYGGFDDQNADFPFRRSPDVETRVQAEGTVFFVGTMEIDTHIEGFTIEARTPSGPGQSSYGVRFLNGNPNSSANLYVRYNKIETDDARDGQNGVDGNDPPGGAAPSGMKGDDACECGALREGGDPAVCAEPGGRGGNGGQRTFGVVGDPGSGGALGGAFGDQAPNSDFPDECGNAFPGLVGTEGGPGNNGNAGAPGQSLGTIASSLYAPAPGQSGQPGLNGRGGGGGGGGGGDRDDQCNTFFCACNANSNGGGGGSGGCGGIGGLFGTGGGGGGGAFAIFAVQGRIIVTDNTINPGNGGDGGDGGDGAEGQNGGNGGPMSAPSADGEGGSGGPGGDGGDGGLGGPGAGGGGGPSACFAYGGGLAQFTFEDNSCSPGLRGDGGNGGTNGSVDAFDGEDGDAVGLLLIN